MSDNSLDTTVYTHQYNFSSLNDKDLSWVFKENADNEAVTNQLNELGLIQRKWNKYSVLKYDRKKLDVQDYKTKGLFRSVIHSNGSILAVSPPKSTDFNEFAQTYQVEECRMDEFVEGTMVNLFYDNDTQQWEMATKSTIGARSHFFKEYDIKNCISNNNESTGGLEDDNSIKQKNTFRSLFLDVCQEVKLDFDVLPKKYCYSFVFQHPLNRIVVPFTEKNLYLISIFHVCKGNIVKCLDRDSFECREIFKTSQVNYPKKYYMKSYNECLDFQKRLKNYKTVGLIIWHTKSGARTKLRNHIYEYVRKLRGNQPKLEYRFLELLREKRLHEYLFYYPEKKAEMNSYKTKHFEFTNQLYSNYISCYIKHERPLKEFPIQFGKLMYSLHQLYIFTLKPNQMFVNKKIVIDYVNNLHPSVLMYSMNLHLRILKRPVNNNIPTMKTKNNQNTFVENNNNLVMSQDYIDTYAMLTGEIVHKNILQILPYNK